MQFIPPEEQRKNINFQHTIVNSIETREALNKLQEQKSKAFSINAFVTIAGIIGFIILFSAYLQNKQALYLILAFTCFGIISGTYAYTKENLIKPYQQLLDNARQNDRIRHEERIRYYERKRLEESKIKEDKNIDLTEKLKEEQKLREKVEKELEELKKWEEENE